MCRQIGVMTGAGITMAKAMEILKNTTENKRIARIYSELEDRIKQGYPIGDSMEALGVFPEMAVNMFRAAEVSGQLEKTANDLAEHYRKEHRTMTQMKAATMYPKILCIMAVSIVLFVFLVIMPMVEPLFSGVELPLVTRILMRISAFLQQDWHIAAAVLVVIILLEPVIFSIHSVKYITDKMILYVPIIGKQMKTIYTARFARSLSGLYASGIPMVIGLEITSRTIGNRYLETQILDVVRAVENGASLSHAIESVHGLDKKLPAVIFVGEETGKLDMMLLSLAEGYEHEAEIAINKLVSMIEPLMIVVIGIVVAVILLGIMIPMWSLYEYIG
ncbi:MAG: type II secretion system F family protein [Lachnospiraceae bacterium]|nr:type II secretion system F family protein [Lachnospiraceae bacterium]